MLKAALFLWLSIFILAPGPSWAFLPPDFWLQKNRASQMLDEPTRARAMALAASLSVTSTTEEFEKLLSAQAAAGPMNASLVFRYYAAMTLVERREEILGAYEPRRKQLQDIDTALADYIRRGQDRLRADNFHDQFSDKKLPEVDWHKSPVQLKQDELGLQTRQWLPWPEHLRTEVVHLALERAEEERLLNRTALEQIQGARSNYDDAQRSWNRYLHQMVRRMEETSDSRLRSGIP